MQAWFQMVLSLNLFIFCINMGFWWIGGIYDDANGVTTTDPTSIAGKSLNFTSLGQNASNTVNTYNSTGGGFNTSFIFGDFGKAIQTLISAGTTGINILSGGYITSTLQNIGFPQSFTMPFQTIVAVLNVGALAYLVSGRW